MSYPYLTPEPIIKQHQFKDKLFGMLNSMEFDKNTRYILRNIQKTYDILLVEFPIDEPFIFMKKTYEYKILYQSRDERFIRNEPFEYYFSIK